MRLTACRTNVDFYSISINVALVHVLPRKLVTFVTALSLLFWTLSCIDALEC